MAITTVYRPFTIVPAHNDIEFKVSSDQSAITDFTFYITLDIPSYSFSTVYQPTGVNGVLNINFSDIIRKYVSNYYPFSSYGWQFVTDGIIDVTVNVGEYYSGAIHAGTDYDFQVWNAALTKEERAVYLPADYIVGTGRNDVWLNVLENQLNTGRTTCRSDQDFVMYFLQTGSMAITDVSIDTYDSSGTLIANSVITSGLAAIPCNGQERYKCINVGPRGLTNIASGSVTGTYPIITASVASYRLQFYGRTTLGGAIQNFQTYIDIDDCSPKFDTWTLHYLNRYGAFDFINMYGNHQRTLQSNKAFYQGLNGYFQGSYEYVGIGNETVDLPVSKNEKVLNSTYQNTQELRSDWLTDNQIERLGDLITSPSVHTQLSGVYRKHSITNRAYRFKNVGEKLQRLDVNLNEGITERRQHE